MDGPRRLQGFEVEHLTRGPEVATAESLDDVVGTLGAVLAELPLRDAGCRLPTWDELVELSQAARDRGVPLHVDGARIWESRPHWDKSFPEIAALVDSMYVSFYKGLRGLAGAALVGPDDFLTEARVWRTRMGGTLYRSTPEALAAIAGLRDLLPRMAECYAWAQALAADRALARSPSPVPWWLQVCGPWWAAREPDRVATEVVVSTPALVREPAHVAKLLAEIALG